MGHPQHASAARPSSKKRRMPSRSSLRDSRSLQDIPATPARSTQPASAPTSRLRKRASAGRPLTSSSNMRGGIRTLGSTPETKLNHGFEDGAEGQSSLQASEQSFGHGPFTFEIKGSENTPPHWLKRMSALSSLKTGSPEPTLRPGSSSISYSNGSTAPMLSNPSGSSPGMSSRNKLVKRSSSQKLLNGSNTLHSTLRRPATSHQRSATLQQQFQQDEEPSRPSMAASSILPSRALGDEKTIDTDSQVWLPSFKAQAAGRSRDGSLRKRNTNSSTYRNECIKTIVPDMNEVATLLMATSLTADSLNEAPNGRASSLSRLSRPLTPRGLGAYESPKPNNTRDEAADAPELKSRHSFSLSEMFPSPSPSTWKMPRTASLRRTKPFIRDTGDRRVVSAPHPGGPRKTARFSYGEGSFGSDNITRSDAENHTGHSEGRTDLPSMQQSGSSSPLPPLSRLSVLEIDLPDATPSYPRTLHPENQDSSPRESSIHSSPSAFSPSAPSVSKTRPYRISSAPSEPGSTLLGSDNDNSRLMSGDEDDLDSRSETMYDSTRTGATDSSHSSKRRPPIDTIFDESPPPELPSKRKLIDLQDLVHRNDSFLAASQKNRQSVEGEADVSTPIPATIPSKEDNSPTPMGDASGILLSPEVPSTSSTEHRMPDQHARNSDPDQDDALWSFERAEISHAEAVHIRNVSLIGSNNPSASTPPQGEVHKRRQSPPSVGGPGKLLKSNLFDWSEQSLPEKESSQGGSPRPKTVHGRQGKDVRGSHANGRRGPSAVHLRSQSVPVQKDMTHRRNHNNPSNLDSWMLGNKGPSEDWDGDFDFEEAPLANKQSTASNDQTHPSHSSGMLVPRNILERQASVHGQFGQVKELALLVEDLKRLQQQAAGQGIMQGQSAELWKEAEGIINLATLDDEEQEIFPPRSPQSPNFDFDAFDEESPSIRSRRKSGKQPPKEGRANVVDDSSGSQFLSGPTQDLSGLETPPRPTSRPRKESTAKAKSVLETIHQQRNHYDDVLLDAPFAQKKLPFDTTSLKDLVTRAGVVTRALKEIVRRAENGPGMPDPRPSTPRDPPYISQMFQPPPISPSLNQSPRITQSPKSPKSQRSGTFMRGNIAANDNDINGHMKMMTVV